MNLKYEYSWEYLFAPCWSEQLSCVMKGVLVENFFGSQTNNRNLIVNCINVNARNSIILTRVLFRFVRTKFAWTHVHVVLERNHLNWIQFDCFCTFCALVANARKPNPPTFFQLCTSRCIAFCVLLLLLLIPFSLRNGWNWDTKIVFAM